MTSTLYVTWDIDILVCVSKRLNQNVFILTFVMTQNVTMCM